MLKISWSNIYIDLPRQKGISDMEIQVSFGFYLIKLVENHID